VYHQSWDLIGIEENLRFSFGKLEGEWEHALFPASAGPLRQSLFNWARFQLVGQALIIVVSLYFGLWIVPIVVTLAPFYGGAIQFLCNNAQHMAIRITSDFGFAVGRSSSILSCAFFIGT
jgi:hypothetical protein